MEMEMGAMVMMSRIKEASRIGKSMKERKIANAKAKIKTKMIVEMAAQIPVLLVGERRRGRGGGGGGRGGISRKESCDAYNSRCNEYGMKESRRQRSCLKMNELEMNAWKWPKSLEGAGVCGDMTQHGGADMENVPDVAV